MLMIIFHFCYDLRYFGYVDWHIPNGPNWWPFRYFIITLFLFTVGVSLALAHYDHFKRINYIRRLGQILVAAGLVTGVSLFLFPKAWIYFGILHFIAAASFISSLVLHRGYLALGLGAAILIAYWLGWLNNEWPFTLIKSWLPHDTEDYVPLFPWLGVVWIGLGFGRIVVPKMVVHKIKGKKKIEKTMDLPNNIVTRQIAWLGKHGLIIYLIHQPLLFGGFYSLQLFG